MHITHHTLRHCIANHVSLTFTTRAVTSDTTVATVIAFSLFTFPYMPSAADCYYLLKEISCVTTN